MQTINIIYWLERILSTKLFCVLQVLAKKKKHNNFRAEKQLKNAKKRQNYDFCTIKIFVWFNKILYEDWELENLTNY